MTTARLAAIAFVVGALLTLGFVRVACADEADLQLTPPAAAAIDHVPLDLGQPAPWDGVLLSIGYLTRLERARLERDVCVAGQESLQADMVRRVQAALTVQGAAGERRTFGWWAGAVTGFVAGGTLVAAVLYYAIQAAGAFAPAL
jgi:hypothetical protein